MKLMSIRWILCVLVTVSAAVTKTPQTTTPRIEPVDGTIKKMTNHPMAANNTAVVTFDTRTPPRVKQLMKMAERKANLENSHPGVAEPLDDHALEFEESMKKLNFYKFEKSTTDSGLSTWILLSGQSTLSPSVTKLSKETNTNGDAKNITIGNPLRLGKPIFKKKPLAKLPTTKLPTTNLPTTKFPTTKVPTTKLPITLAKLSTALPNLSTTTPTPERTTKLTKLKSSILSNAFNKTRVEQTNLKVGATNKNELKVEISTTTKNDLIRTGSQSAELKEGALDLSTVTTTPNPKKTRRTTNKKKKDKNRRRPSAEDKIDAQNKTKLSNKVNQKQKPIGTQIYNYLAREVMPTVGVGLVGLMVTAGLASYFLYPFGSLRRSYEIDRKDKEGSYYYGDYTGGIAEEDAIGKVIAGMPFSSNFKNNRFQSSRNNYPSRYGNANPQGSVQTVQLNHFTDYSNEINKNDPFYNNVNSQIVGATYKSKDQFIVDNPEQTDVTPAAVPEQGPRRLRKRRNINDYVSNEIDDTQTKYNHVAYSNMKQKISEASADISTTATISPTDTVNSDMLSDKLISFLNMFKDLLYLKLRMGLEMLQNKARVFSNYISNVQERLNTMKH